MSGHYRRCASRELIAACRGEIPVMDTRLLDLTDLHCACENNRTHLCGAVLAVHGSDIGYAEEDTPIIDCAACLTLIAVAHGPVRDDALQLREAAKAQRRIEAKMNRLL